MSNVFSEAKINNCVQKIQKHASEMSQKDRKKTFCSTLVSDVTAGADCSHGPAREKKQNVTFLPLTSITGSVADVPSASSSSLNLCALLNQSL